MNHPVRISILMLLLGSTIAVSPTTTEAALFGGKSSRKYRQLRDEGKKALEHYNFLQAEASFRGALTEATPWGEKNSNYGESLENLVGTLTFLHRNRDAEPFAELLVKAHLQRHGDKSIQYASALYQHGKVLVQLGKPARAEGMLNRSHEIAINKQGVFSPSAGYAKIGLAQLRVTQNRLSDAEKYYEDALKLMGEYRTRLRGVSGGAAVYKFNPKTRDVVYASLQQLWVLQQLGKLDKADESLKKLTKFVESKLGQNHAVNVDLLLEAGRIEAARKNDKAAEEHFNSAMKLAEAMRSTSKFPIQLVTMELFRFYGSRNRNVEAEKTGQELQQLGVTNIVMTVPFPWD